MSGMLVGAIHKRRSGILRLQNALGVDGTIAEFDTTFDTFACVEEEQSHLSLSAPPRRRRAVVPLPPPPPRRSSVSPSRRVALCRRRSDIVG